MRQRIRQIIRKIELEAPQTLNEIKFAGLILFPCNFTITSISDPAKWKFNEAAARILTLEDWFEQYKPGGEYSDFEKVN